MRNLSHTDAAHRQRSFYTKKLLHRCFYIDALKLRVSELLRRELLHTKPVQHANKLLDAGAFTHKNFLHTHTQTSDPSPVQGYCVFSSVFRIDARFVQGMVMKGKPNRDFALIWTIGRRFAREGRFGARPFFLLADAFCA